MERHRGHQIKEAAMTAVTTSTTQTAGTLGGSPDAPVYAVVGFDGSPPALRALDAAARLLHDRPGGMEIVYVAHLPAIAAAADLDGQAAAGLRQSLDDSARELSTEVRTRLQATHLRGAAQHWHFQRRDGAVADQLTAVADELRLQRGPTPRSSSSSADPRTDTTTFSARSRTPWSGTITTRWSSSHNAPTVMTRSRTARRPRPRHHVSLGRPRPRDRAWR